MLWIILAGFVPLAIACALADIGGSRTESTLSGLNSTTTIKITKYGLVRRLARRALRGSR